MRSNTYPTKYPHGWYPLCYSWEVPNGKVIKKEAFGKHFVIFRAQNTNEIGILDAYCPHMGADLSVGSIVCDNLLQCSFHQWRFDIHGKCQAMPLSSSTRIPSNANAKCYHSIEYHQMICVYHGNQIPLYELPVQLDVISDEFIYHGKLEYELIRMNIQEFAENSADFMHFASIHSQMMFPFTQFKIPFIHHWLSIHHSPTVLIGNQSKDLSAIKDGEYDKYMITGGTHTKTDPHFMYFLNDSHLQWKGKRIQNTNGLSCITFCGPGSIVIFRICIPSYDRNACIVLFHTHLPEDEMCLRVRFHWYANKKLPSLLVWYVVGNWISQWRNDIKIWENKIFRRKPCLVKGDGPIMQVRRWFAQFYFEDNCKKSNIKEEKMCGEKINNITTMNGIGNHVDVW